MQTNLRNNNASASPENNRARSTYPYNKYNGPRRVFQPPHNSTEFNIQIKQPALKKYLGQKSSSNDKKELIKLRIRKALLDQINIQKQIRELTKVTPGPGQYSSQQIKPIKQNKTTNLKKKQILKVLNECKK